MQFQKEDSLVTSYDVEISECNMYDTPYEVYCTCFPSEKKPTEKLTELYRNTFSSYLTKKESLSIRQIEDVVTSSRNGMSKLDMDLYMKAVIEGEFRVELAAETHISWKTIIESPVDELVDQPRMKEKLNYVKTEPSQLSDYTVFNNKLIKGI